MSTRNLYMLIFILVLLTLKLQPSESKKKVVIHIPYRVKNVKHTHTVYKIIPSHRRESKDEHKSDEDHDDVEFYHRRR